MTADTPDSAVRTGDGAILRLLDRPILPEDQKEGTLFAARPAEPAGFHSFGVLLFRLGDETACIAAKLLRRVTPAVRPSPIPHRTDGLLRGLCNIRGDLVLCADIRALLGLPPQTPAPSPARLSDARRMIVIGRPDDSWAFEVDALVGVERVTPEAISPPPVTVAYAMSKFTSGIVQIDGKPATLLDGERIIAGFRAGLS